jgi:transglutaminase-like putative cysteine protease
MPSSGPIGAVARTFADEAARLVPDAADDAVVLAAITQHLRGSRPYLDGRDAPDDAASLAAFAEGGPGSCAQFAEAAVLMLRSRNLAARLVHGFLVRRFDPNEGAYTARASDYHAWAEVWFDETGWVVCDPTPDSSLVAQTSSPAASDWSARLDSVLDRLLRQLRDLSQFVRTNPLAVGILLLLSSLVTGLWLAGRARRAAERKTVPAQRAAAPVHPAWTRLVLEIERCGYARRPSATVLAFAEQLAGLDPERFSGLPRVAAAWCAHRFGGASFDGPDGVAAAEALRTSLAASRATRRPGRA